MPAASAKKPTFVYRGEGSSWFQPLVWNCGRVISRILTIILFRLHVGGVNRIPRKGPVLLVTNHQSFLDPWLIGVALHRQVHYMARDTLFKGGFLGWLMETLNAYPVKRGSADLGAIRATVELLQKGYMVNIFPEGTRSEDGTIGPIAAGVALILGRVQVPVVPVVIDGGFEAWPRHQKLPHARAIRILHGAPLSPEYLGTLKPGELAQVLRGELVRLQEEIRSPHAAASRRRLEAEKPAAGEGRRRRG